MTTVNLPEEYVKQLRQMFKCAQCRSNEHTLPYCPLMKNWIIKKKPRNDNNSKTESPLQSGGSVNSVLASPLSSSDISPNVPDQAVPQPLIHLF